MSKEVKGTHDYLDDPRNSEVLVYVNGKYFPRQDAKISVFDSGFLLGDGVWEGIRLHNGKLLFLEEHLERLFWGAAKIDMDLGKTLGEITEILYDTIIKNDMFTGVHLRLIVSRGIKSTPYQDPSFTISEPSIVVIPEYKLPYPEVQSSMMSTNSDSSKTSLSWLSVQQPLQNEFSGHRRLKSCTMLGP